MASLDNHLKALDEEGVIVREGKYPIRFYLRPEGELAQEGQARARHAARIPDDIPPKLQRSLGWVRERLAARLDVEVKIQTLDMLADMVRPDLAKILRSIRQDYTRS